MAPQTIVTGQTRSRPIPSVRTPATKATASMRSPPATEAYRSPNGPNRNVSTRAAPTDLSFGIAPPLSRDNPRVARGHNRLAATVDELRAVARHLGGWVDVDASRVEVGHASHTTEFSLNLRDALLNECHVSLKRRDCVLVAGDRLRIA